MASYVPHSEITYPVYKISDNMWYDTDDTGSVISQDPRTGHRSILDYTHGVGPKKRTTFAERRMAFLRDKESGTVNPLFQYNLSSIEKTYKTRTDHMMYGPSGKYIDNAGKIFTWHKSRYHPLQYYKIKSVKETAIEGVYLIKLIGTDKTIISRYKNPVGYAWAALIFYEGGALLYGYAKGYGANKRSKLLCAQS